MYRRRRQRPAGLLLQATHILVHALLVTPTDCVRMHTSLSMQHNVPYLKAATAIWMWTNVPAIRKSALAPFPAWKGRALKKPATLRVFSFTYFYAFTGVKMTQCAAIPLIQTLLQSARSLVLVLLDIPTECVRTPSYLIMQTTVQSQRVPLAMLTLTNV